MSDGDQRYQFCSRCGKTRKVGEDVGPCEPVEEDENG